MTQFRMFNLLGNRSFVLEDRDYALVLKFLDQVQQCYSDLHFQPSSYPSARVLNSSMTSYQS